MEDSVGEEERREQGETAAQAKAHQEEVAAAGGGGGGGEPAQDGGFLSAMASKIGATMSETNGSGGEANAAAASDGEALKRDGDGDPGEEGGFLSAMASKIGAAMSGANGGSESDGGGTAAVASDDEGKQKDEGNGGSGIFHTLLSSSPAASSPASGALEAEEAKGEGKDQGVPDEQTGILNAMASKIVMAMSAANGNGNHGTEDATKTSNGHAVDVSSGEEKGGDANGGGILNTMASKIGMAMSGANGDEDHGGSGVNAKTSNGNSVDVSKDEKTDEMNGGGILSAVASKIGMANGSGNHSTEDDARKSNGDAVNGSKGEEEKEKGHDANGAGIVEQIISNLPSDDQALDSDEASLLIAIIED